MATPDSSRVASTERPGGGATATAARSTPAPRASRIARWARRLAWVVAGVAAVYLVGANLFLNLWFGALFAGTNTITMSFDRGWTVWPGSVHVRDVRVVFQDHNLQWTLDLERASLDVKLGALVRRTFHATSVVGEGTVFRMRMRVEPHAVDAPGVAALAPIPEFPGPPMIEAWVPEPPVEDAEYALWTVHLENVDVGVSETWVQQFRYVGAGRARGAFRLRPARALWVGPATLELEPGRLTAGPHLITPSLSADIECTVHPFDVREPSGRSVFKYISVNVSLDAPNLELTAAELFEPAAPDLRAESGNLEVQARIERGVVRDESHVTVRQHGLVIPHPRGTARVGLAELVLRAVDGRGQAELSVDGATLALGPSAPPIVVERVNALAESSSVDTTADWKLTVVELREARLSATDLRALGSLLPPSLQAGGGARVAARGAYREARLDAELEAELDGVRLARGAAEVELHGSAHARADQVSFASRSGALAARLQRGRLLLRDGASSRFEAGGVELELKADAKDGAGQGSLHATLGSLRLRSGDLRLASRGELHASIDDWDVERHSASSRLSGTLRALALELPGAELRAQADRVVLRSFSRTGPEPHPDASQPSRVELDATLFGLTFEQGQGNSGIRGTARELDWRSELAARADGSLDAVVRTKGRELEATYDRFRLQATPELELVLDGFDSERGRGRARASVELTGLSAHDPKGDKDCPWSTIDRASLTGKAELRPGGAALAFEAAVDRARFTLDDFTTTLARADARVELDSAVLEHGGALVVGLDLHDARFASGGSAPLGWDASVPRVRLETTLERAASSLDGPLRVNALDARARIGHTRFAADLGVDVGQARFELDRGHLTGAGKLRIRELALALPEEKIENWWADVELLALDLWTEQNLEGTARFRATLRDGLPALAVLAEQGELPGFVPEIFPLRNVQAQGKVRRSCQLTEFEVEEVVGGPFTASGRLQSVPESVNGAFLVRLAAAAPIAAGVRFGERGSGVSMFAGSDWLKEQYGPLDRAAKAAEQQACVPPPRECGVPAQASLTTSEARATPRALPSARTGDRSPSARR